MTGEHTMSEILQQQPVPTDLDKRKRLLQSNNVLTYHFVNVYNLNDSLIGYDLYPPALRPATAIKDAVKLHEDALALKALYEEYCVNVHHLEVRLKASKKMVATLKKALLKKEGS